MGSALFMAGCLIGTSVLYTIIMAIVTNKTVATEKLEIKKEGEKNL